MKNAKLILPIIVISQFCCTSLWFAGNGVMHDLVTHFGLQKNALGHLTSAVQMGFIVGTLVFALFTIADRFSPSKVFFVCGLLGAGFNLAVIWEGNNLISILLLRFLTGFFLAGIYPIGMKIASDYYRKGLGKSLGFLVGALVLGTALPHMLKQLSGAFVSVLIMTSSLAVLGGLLMIVFIPDGPYRKAGQSLTLSGFLNVFQVQKFRAAAFGYFGHMWELYAFWAFVPSMLKLYTIAHPEVDFNIPLLSFFIIGTGSLSCVLSGYLSQTFGTERVAFVVLLLSGCCCLLSPLVFSLDSEQMFLGFLLFWGIVVIADSPLFSTMVAQNVPEERKGTALTLVNCIGFAITIVSIQLINGLSEFIHPNSIYVILGLGPIVGLLALVKNKKSETE